MTGLMLPERHNASARDRIVLLFMATALGVVVLYRQSPSSAMWMPAALAGMALAIWHGAYDTVLARNLWEPRYAGRWLLPFVGSYVGLAAVVVIAWSMFPVAALALFLLYSGLHFGTEAEHGAKPLQIASAFAFGCLPIVAACHWQASSVVSIFVTMLRGRADSAQNITTVAGSFLLPCSLASLAVVLRDRREGRRRAALVASVLLLFRSCPPVLAFAVFFCVLHTPEHLVETSRDAVNTFSARRMWRNLRAGVASWLLSLAALAIAAWLGRHTVQSYTGLLFIALSALTVPHMALAMLVAAQSRQKDQLSFHPAQRAAHP